MADMNDISVSTDMLLSCWGKTDPNSSDSKAYHPALFHILDVAHVAQVLLSDQCSPRWRNAFIDIYQTDISSLRAFIPYFVALHDIGKFSAAFQRMNEAQYQRLISEGFSFGRSKDLPHSHVSRNFIWYEWPPVMQSRLSETNRKILREVVAGHHGQFLSVADLGDVKIQLRIEEPQIWKSLRASAFKIITDLFLDQSPQIIPEPINVSAAIMQLTGFTTLCDWIGSDQRFFEPQPELRIEEYLKVSRVRAEIAVMNDGFSTSTLSSSPITFSGLFHTINSPRPLQLAIDAIPEKLLAEPSLTVIEAPTGEGKTEAALALAHRIAFARHTDELYYALPTTATSNQMFLRVQKYLRDQLDLGIGVKLIHGQAFLEQDVLSIKPLDNGASNGGDKVVIDWFTSKKRALLAPFGVGTIDQIELAALNVRHTSLRLAGLAGKVIILDEVHAYDTYMTTIVVRLLAWLRSLGTSVIILSATLPAKRRNELLRTYYSGEDPLSNQSEYPLILTATSTSLLQLTPVASNPSREIGLTFLHFAESDVVEKAHWLLNQVDSGGCVCWITNTVNRAQEIYQEVLEQASVDVVTVLIHARYPLDQRGEIERKIVELVGPDKSKRPRSAIIIGTQVLEQSLDLDFDLMVSDLAPVDLLLQRAGRLHRHAGTIRPGSHQLPVLVVNIPLVDDRPVITTDKYVYAEFFLERTYQVLKEKKTLNLPGDYRILVEQVYGQPQAEMSPDIKTLFQELQKDEELARQEAVQRLIPEPHPEELFTSLAAHLVFSESETQAGYIIAQTRLGERSISVIPLEDRGEFCSLPGSHKQLNKNLAADKVDQLALLRSHIRISNQNIVTSLSDQKVDLPLLFTTSPLLRDFLPLWLKGGLAEIRSHELTLDPQLGLIIRKKGG